MTESTAPTTAPPTSWHAQSTTAVLAALGTSAERGLTSAGAAARLAATGPNRLVRPREITFWRVAREELTEPMILLLLAVGAVYALWGEPRDAGAIVMIILTILGIELAIEFRAKRAVAALANLAPLTATVVRDGTARELDAAGLVPGDIVLLRTGERVPADLRLLTSYGLAADESALTGESLPVEKDAAARLAPDTPLAERATLVYAGTIVARGGGRAVVVATGLATELGRIAGLVEAAREPKTPLQRAMKGLSASLVKVALAFSVAIPLLGILRGQPVKTMLLTGMTLAFATIPEEMPIVITLVLGLGALALARRGVLVKRLHAAETLGAVTVLCTDKTGTLTENQPRVACLAPLPGVSEAELARAATLASEPESTDPLDRALRDADATPLPADWTLVASYPFSEQTRAATLAYRTPTALVVYTKGALETLLSPTPSSEEAALRARAAALAGEGFRVLAVGQRELPRDTTPTRELALARPRMLGLVAFHDPPRPEVASAVRAARQAGLRVILTTGDHPATATAIARAVGLPTAPLLTGADVAALDAAGWRDAARATAIFARVLPEQKLRLVEALQASGAVVAMTGDGVNDAPALKAANVGVAMGRGGTDVAREAAGIVLTEDSFATLVEAIAAGRRLYDNLRKGVRYYLAIKVALIATSLLSVIFGLPVPFTPIQIIVLELFMDANAAFGFALEPAEPDVMRRPPRDPRAPFLDRDLRASIFLGGLCLFLTVTAAYWRVLWTAGTDEVARAQTAAFLTWLLGHAALALAMRGERTPFRPRALLTNPVITLWTVAVLVTTLLAAVVPAVRGVLKTVPLTGADWIWTVALALATGLAFELARRVRGVGVARTA